MSKSRLGLALACAAAVFLAACEGLFTGARESIHPLTQQQDGGFAPVRITLDPEMNPIAFNLKGATLDSPSEAGRWNADAAQQWWANHLPDLTGPLSLEIVDVEVVDARESAAAIS